MKRSLLFVIAPAAFAASGPLFAQPAPEIGYEAIADFLSLPSHGEVAGVANELQGPHLRLRANGPRLRHARRRADLLSRRLAIVPVRSDRQIRPGDRPGHLRDEFRPAGEG